MRKSRKPKVEDSNGGGASDAEYEVEKIVKKRTRRGKAEYLVRWKGFEESDDTWEDEANLTCPDLIEEFNQNEPEEDDDDEPLVPKKKGKRGRPAKGAKKASKKARKENDSDTDEEKEYEVSKIVEVHHKKNGTREFLVRWKGFKPDDDTWEPEAHLNCQDLIEEFMKKVEKIKQVSHKETRVNRKKTDRYAEAQKPGRRAGRVRGPRKTYAEDDD